MEDIDCGVGISIENCPTFGTYPMPYLEIFRTGPLCATFRASLAGRIETVYGYKLLTVPLSLIGELPSEFAPACIGNGFCQLMISYHIFRCKIFDADHIILTNDFRG